MERADAVWREEDHPRAPDGKFGSGGGATRIKSGLGGKLPAASKALTHHHPKKLAAMRTIVERAETAEEAAENLRKFTATLAHPVFANYANQIIGMLESEHELPKGALGKATTKAKVEPPPEPPAKPPPPRPVEPPPSPPETKGTPVKPGSIAALPDAPVALTKWNPKKLAAIHTIIQRASTIQEAAEHLRAFAGTLAHPVYAGYVNRILAKLEEFHGLPHGSLGEAVPKPSTKKPTPAKPPTPDKPHPPPKNAPKTISDVLDRRTDWRPTEREWQRDKWQHATPTFLAAMLHVKPLQNVVEKPQTTSFYSHSHFISMGTKDPVVWRHEYGHAMDYNGTGFPLSWKADEARVDEAKNLVAREQFYFNQSGEEPREQVENDLKNSDVSYEELRSFAGGPVKARALGRIIGGRFAKADLKDVSTIWSENLHFQDFLGAMTHNKVGYGHSDDYYRQARTRHCSEMFANYVGLTQGPGGKVFRALMHGVAPRVCAQFDQIIERRAEGR